MSICSPPGMTEADPDLNLPMQLHWTVLTLPCNIQMWRWWAPSVRHAAMDLWVSEKLPMDQPSSCSQCHKHERNHVSSDKQLLFPLFPQRLRDCHNALCNCLKPSEPQTSCWLQQGSPCEHMHILLVAASHHSSSSILQDKQPMIK